MLKNYLYVLFILILWVMMNACGQPSSLHSINLQTSADLQEFFAYSEGDVPLISGHRGGAKNGYPENT